MTSHDVVAKARRGLNIKKVGHAGTLDPLATGVLVLCLGMATRLSDYVMHSTKRYEARVHLGVTTETYDAEGEIVQQRDATHIQRTDVEQALTQFRGDIEQRPPMYSAIKKDGRKLYELARAGETIDVPARSVRIDALEITDWQPPEFTLNVTCSSGTYIRSLAYDLGEALGVGAYLAGLARTASGRFTLDNAAQLDAVLAADDWQQYLIPPEIALADYPRLDVDDEAAEHLRHGRSIEGATAKNDEIVMAYTPDGRLLAILRARGGLWKPQKVFT
jgi:tRNA pseudouridine55 synthase